MKTWHLRVLDQSGKGLTTSLAAWRYFLACAWWMPPLLLAAFNELTQLAAITAGVAWLLLTVMVSAWRSDSSLPYDVLLRTQVVVEKKA